MDTIDFVITWVDGSDPEWLCEKRKFIPDKQIDITDDRIHRYRDYDLLQYWFRAVEKFAPWVNKVHFVTCGHKPSWLNLNCPKLNFVKHSDFMPEEFLPTFSSHPIELNLHRIKGLTDKFVYFNDDMFLSSSVKPEDFFDNGLPVYPALLHPILPIPDKGYEIMSHIFINMVTLINRNFNAKKSIKTNRDKWFNPFVNGMRTTIMNAFYSQHLHFVGFYNEHLPSPTLKATMEEVWECEKDTLYATSLNKFRGSSDVSPWLFRYWDLAAGNFSPVKVGKLGKRYRISKDSTEICSAVTNQIHKLICINDTPESLTADEFNHVINDIREAFDKIFPEKSSFEL